MARPMRDDSLLLKSAESLGRMIGTLQRQLEAASKRLSPAAAPEDHGAPARVNGATRNKAAARKRTPSAAGRKTAGKKSAAKKTVPNNAGPAKSGRKRTKAR